MINTNLQVRCKHGYLSSPIPPGPQDPSNPDSPTVTFEAMVCHSCAFESLEAHIVASEEGLRSDVYQALDGIKAIREELKSLQDDAGKHLSAVEGRIKDLLVAMEGRISGDISCQSKLIIAEVKCQTENVQIFTNSRADKHHASIIKLLAEMEERIHNHLANVEGRLKERAGELAQELRAGLAGIMPALAGIAQQLRQPPSPKQVLARALRELWRCAQ